MREPLEADLVCTFKFPWLGKSKAYNCVSWSQSASLFLACESQLKAGGFWGKGNSRGYSQVCCNHPIWEKGVEEESRGRSWHTASKLARPEGEGNVPSSQHSSCSLLEGYITASSQHQPRPFPGPSIFRPFCSTHCYGILKDFGIHLWPGLRLGCRAALQPCTQSILLSPRAATWISLMLLLTCGMMEISSSCLWELRSTVISSPHNPKDHIIIQDSLGADRSFGKKYVRESCQPRGLLFPPMGLEILELSDSSLLWRCIEGENPLQNTQDVSWHWNHFLKKHSHFSELPIAWNEEIPVCGYAETWNQSQNICQWKNKVTFTVNESCNK